MLETAVQSPVLLLVLSSYVWTHSLLQGSVLESLLEVTPGGSLL